MNLSSLNISVTCSDLVHARFWTRLRSPHTGTRRLKSETLEAVNIPDAPLPMQEQLVAYLDNVQEEVSEMRRLQAQDAELHDQLEQSILERAFRGEL